MISLDITKSFDDPGRAAPFHLGIHLEMPEDSRTLVLFGASGSGKTLTLHCLAGLVRPDAGRIVVDGNVLYDGGQGICVPARRRRIGYMFQDYALFPHLSVLHNVAYAGTGLLPWRLTREQRAWAMDLLERLGIAHLARLYPGNLSGGQKQRVALARALGTRPSLLLLDEPFSALDPLLRERLRGEIQEILAAFAIPAVIISHDPEDVDAFAGTLVTYHRGRARMIPDYASLRRAYASAGDCLRHLQQQMQAESARQRASFGRLFCCSFAPLAMPEDAPLHHGKDAREDFCNPVAWFAEGTDFACHWRQISFE